MENWQLALVIIAAIFAGVAIPMIIQYQTTLRSIDRLVRNSEGDVRRTLYELAQLAGHLNRISAAVDGNTKHLRTAFETFDELADGVRRMRGSMKTASIVGAAVAPALSAVIRALQGGAPTTDEEAERAMITERAELEERVREAERTLERDGARALDAPTDAERAREARRARRSANGAAANGATANAANGATANGA